MRAVSSFSSSASLRRSSAASRRNCMARMAWAWSWLNWNFLRQVLFCRLSGAAAADGVDHLVDDVQGFEQALDDVQTRLPLCQLVPAATHDHVEPVLDKVDQHLAQRKTLGAHDGLAVRLFCDQSQGVHPESLAQLAARQNAPPIPRGPRPRG